MQEKGIYINVFNYGSRCYLQVPSRWAPVRVPTRMTSWCPPHPIVGPLKPKQWPTFVYVLHIWPVWCGPWDLIIDRNNAYPYVRTYSGGTILFYVLAHFFKNQPLSWDAFLRQAEHDNFVDLRIIGPTDDGETDGGLRAGYIYQFISRYLIYSSEGSVSTHSIMLCIISCWENTISDSPMPEKIIFEKWKKKRTVFWIRPK